METKKQPGISSQHLEAILASEGRQEDVEEEVGMEDNETVSEKSSKKSASHACKFFFIFGHITNLLLLELYFIA